MSQDLRTSDISLIRSSIEQVIASGKKHGATRADIIGCLHFHIKDQLLEFATRMERFHMAISVLDRNPTQLAEDIRTKRISLGPFDRVETSFILNKTPGVDAFLNSWGPLLNPNNPHSTLIGCCINWNSDIRGIFGKSFPESERSSVNRKGKHRFPVSFVAVLFNNSNRLEIFSRLVRTCSTLISML